MVHLLDPIWITILVPQIDQDCQTGRLIWSIDLQWFERDLRSMADAIVRYQSNEINRNWMSHLYFAGHIRP